MAVAPFVIGALQNGLNTSGLPAAADVSIGNVFTQIYNALGILPLVLVILALVIILSAIFLLVPDAAEWAKPSNRRWSAAMLSSSSLFRSES